MKKRKNLLTLAFAFVYFLLAGCAQTTSAPKERGAQPSFAADFLGVYYVTDEKTVCFIPFSKDEAEEYNLEIGKTNGLSNITAICAEGDGHIGAVDSAGTYHTTCGIQPEQAKELIPDAENVGAGSMQIFSTAQDFAGLSNISFFQSAYPLWGLFVHQDGSVTIPGLDEDAKKICGSWTDVIQLAGSQDVIALTADGTVLCMPDSPYKSTYESWDNISALYSDYATNIFAVTHKGDVLFSGEDHWGEGAVNDWHNIVSVAAAPSFTVGLCADGTVVAAGSNDCGQCDVMDWKDIVTIAVSSSVSLNGETVYTAGIDSTGNLWISGKIQSVAYNGIYLEGIAQDYLILKSKEALI